METSYTASSASPAVQLPTNRSLLKFILLSIITLGIYGLVVMTKISTEINTIASPYDNKKNHELLPGGPDLLLADYGHRAPGLGPPLLQPRGQ